MKNNRVILLLGILIVSNLPALSQVLQVGLFDGHDDIGTVTQAGSATFHADDQHYELSGSGVSSPGKQDEFHFMWKRMVGDFVLFARARFESKGRDNHRQLGWMIRNKLDGNSSYVSVVVQGNGATSLQFRKSAGDSIKALKSVVRDADVIQLERIDSTYIMRVARFGEPFVTQEITTDSELGDSLYVGLFVSSDGENGMEKGIFRDVRVTVPVDPSLAFIRTNIGSNLEVLNIVTGDRELLFTDSSSIYAPVWKKDSKGIIFSKLGLIYSYDLEKRTTQLINTGDIKDNRIDHVLSFDGKMLGFSSFVKELNINHLYTVPVNGGIPVQVTSKGSSYPHGFSPDGNFLLFCGIREGKYDVYKISVRGGEEIRLTSSIGVNDGPEYAPDGKYIYFNSNRNGSMLIYRMRPDGSQVKPLSSGQFHDWFPHVSPDGKWIVFLSYAKDEVSSSGRASYRQVYLRMMPSSGGPARIIAYLYGGQGSINSPSWSPDSKKIAFASYNDFNQ